MEETGDAGIASMGPHFFRAENDTNITFDLVVFDGFNGAALF